MEQILYGVLRDVPLRELSEAHIREQGGRLLCYVDDDAGKQDAALGICPTSRIAETPRATVVIMSAAVQEIEAKIRAMGGDHEIFVAPLFGYRFICDRPDRGARASAARQFMRENYAQLKGLYDGDDAYTNRLLAQRARESERFELVPVAEYRDLVCPIRQDYFSYETVSPSGDITLMDCGVYTGDSIEAIYRVYGDALRYIYAFEPDAENMSSTRATLRRIGLSEKTECFGCGVWERDGELRFKGANDALGQDDSGDILLPVRTIDSVMRDRVVAGKLCIKMDLEGAECGALRGARETILRHRPWMAICVYHHMADILDVPQTIRDICPEYRFYLRGGLHTACYAVPDKGA